eukprot:gene1079-biopygen303
MQTGQHARVEMTQHRDDELLEIIGRMTSCHAAMGFPSIDPYYFAMRPGRQRRQAHNAYDRAHHPQQPAVLQTRPTEQSVAAALDELLQLQLQQQQAQQQGIRTLQAEQGQPPGEPLIAPEIPHLLPPPEQNPNHPAENTALHYMAPMNNACPHCGAKYFKEELNTSKKYTKCCRGGAITLPAVQPPRPTIRPLFLGDTEDMQRESNDFLSKFRQYNSTLAMASWTANIPQIQGRGSPVITIHGSAYCRTAHIRPLQGQKPKYAELYIMDTAKALGQRTNNSSNKNLNKDTIKKLQDELLAVNPYAQECKHIG